MNQANEFTEVFRAANLSQGGVIREMLLDNGIDCYMNPSVPTLPWDGDVRVLCGVSDAARARELIGAYLQSEFTANEDEEDEEGENEQGEDEDEEDEEDLDDEEDEDLDDEDEDEDEEDEEDDEQEEEEEEDTER